jgi:anhydro-N-acetylmuramic acid kinase
MNKGKYSVIGVMSGTSLDGIDIVHVQFYLEPQWQFKVLKAETIQYTSYWKQALQALVDLKPEALEVLDKAYRRSIRRARRSVSTDRRCAFIF